MTTTSVNHQDLWSQIYDQLVKIGASKKEITNMEERMKDPEKYPLPLEIDASVLLLYVHGIQRVYDEEKKNWFVIEPDVSLAQLSTLQLEQIEIAEGIANSKLKLQSYPDVTLCSKEELALRVAISKAYEIYPSQVSFDQLLYYQIMLLIMEFEGELGLNSEDQQALLYIKEQVENQVAEYTIRLKDGRMVMVGESLFTVVLETFEQL